METRHVTLFTLPLFFFFSLFLIKRGQIANFINSFGLFGGTKQQNTKLNEQSYKSAFYYFHVLLFLRLYLDCISNYDFENK